MTLAITNDPLYDYFLHLQGQYPACVCLVGYDGHHYAFDGSARVMRAVCHGVSDLSASRPQSDPQPEDVFIFAAEYLDTCLEHIVKAGYCIAVS